MNTVPVHAPAIEFDQWTFTYRDAHSPSLNEVSASIARGECVTVMGASGSGKSSLCLSASGAIPQIIHGHHRGRVLLQGNCSSQMTSTQLANLTGMVLQDFDSQLFSSTILQELAFGLENQNFNADAIAERITKHIGRTLLAEIPYFNPANLSGGLRQLLAILSVLTIEPALLCFDEPTTDLDPQHRRMIHDVLREAKALKTAILIADHRPESAFTSDTVWLMKNGQLVAAGPPRNLMTDVNLLRSCSVQPPGIVMLLHELTCHPMTWLADDAEWLIRQRWNVPVAARSPQSFTTVHAENAVLEVRELTFSYPGNDFPALDRLDLTIRRGEFAAILGANGCGKSTLLKHFIRLLEPTRGEVFIDGVRALSQSRKSIAETIGYVFQNPDQQIFAPTVEEEIHFGLRNFGISRDLCKRRTAESLAAVGLAGHESRDPFKMTRGERQRLAVATALAMRPRILLLDEPTKGIDAEHHTSLMEMIANLHCSGHTVVMVTHSVELAAEFANRVIIMNRGKVCLDGSPKDVLAESATLLDAHIVLPESVKLSNRLGLASFVPSEMAREIRTWTPIAKTGF